MKTIITATNDTLVAAHIKVITAKTGSALMGTSKALLIEEAKRQMRNGVCHFIYLKRTARSVRRWAHFPSRFSMPLSKEPAKAPRPGVAATITMSSKVPLAPSAGKIFWRSCRKSNPWGLSFGDSPPLKRSYNGKRPQFVQSGAWQGPGRTDHHLYQGQHRSRGQLPYFGARL